MTPDPNPARKILIVDDHPIVRMGIAAMLAQEPNYEVCGEAADEEQALACVRALKPDLAIVDLSLTSGTSFSLFGRMLQLAPAMRILVLSMHDESVYAEKVLQAGAHGYVMKQEATATLLEALGTLFAGQRYVSNRERDRLLGQIAAPASHAAGGEELTRSERVVLELIGKGYSSRDIAEHLCRSIKTIDVHRANIRAKLDLPSNAALVHYAIRHNRNEV